MRAYAHNIEETTMTITATTPDAPELTTGTWTIDPGHAEVAFVGRHFGLTKVRGRFTGIDGTLTVGDDITDSHVEVEIDMASVVSGNPDRDDHLRSADLFDVEHHPIATFRSSRVDRSGSTAVVTGDLTIKDITRSVSLAVDYLGRISDPWGNDKAIFSAHTTIDREDWGITFNMVLEAGGLLVSKEIRIEIEVELVRQTG
jgi:polyisoprenoid-binding protein YceI